MLNKKEMIFSAIVVSVSFGIYFESYLIGIAIFFTLNFIDSLLYEKQ